LTAQPLTSGAFAPFGDVIESEGHMPVMINDGMTERYHALAQVELQGNDAHALLNLFVARQAYRLPMVLSSVERHPLGSQAFVPLQTEPFIVVVARADAKVTADGMPAEQLQAFVTNGKQGVNYHAGVWHHSLISFQEQARFLVVDRGGPGNNCDVLPIVGETLLTGGWNGCVSINAALHSCGHHRA